MSYNLMTFAAVLVPHGRCNRIGLLFISQVIVAIEIAVFGGFCAAGSVGYGMDAVKALSLWLTFASFSKRLHDLGYSAWWLAAGIVGLLAWLVVLCVVSLALAGPSALQPGSTLIGPIVVLIVLPVIALILWLHLTPGQPNDNTFGPAPGPSGFSRAPRFASDKRTVPNTVPRPA